MMQMIVDYDVDYGCKIVDYDVDLCMEDGWKAYAKSWTIGK